MPLELAALDPGGTITPGAINPGGPMVPYIPPPVPEAPYTPAPADPTAPAWYSPAPTPAATDAAAVGVGPVAGPANTVAPAPFTDTAFAVQAPGAMVGPLGAPFAASMPPGFAAIVFPAASGARVSATEHEQLDGLPFMPHFTFRAGVGGMARVLHGLGLAGPTRLPRELERHAARRTPLTP